MRICSSLIESLLVTRSRDVSVTVSEEETPEMDRSRDHNYGKLNGSRRTPHEPCSIIVIIRLKCSFVVVVVGVDI